MFHCSLITHCPPLEAPFRSMTLFVFNASKCFCMADSLISKAAANDFLLTEGASFNIPNISIWRLLNNGF